MEKTTHSAFSKLMSFVFIAMGVFLGIYAFSTNATTWTVWAIDWDNSNYLSGSFRDENPTTWDIITALYGSGDDGSVYTENWSGYNSGSCLNAGMDVVYTGVIPNTLDSNTIYVIASGTYEVTSTIEMNSCSALISSGIVTLSWAMTNNPFIYSEDAHNIILENIGIVSYNTDRTPWDGIQIYNSTNFSINNTSVYNRNNWISLPLSLYWNITRIETYENTNGLYLYSSENIIVEEINTHDNTTIWISLQNSGNNSFDNIISNNNSLGFYAENSSFINLSNFTGNINTNKNIYLNNVSDSTIENIDISFYWFYLSGCYDNNFTNIHSYNNPSERAIDLNNCDNNVFENITTNNSVYGIRLSNSSGNDFNTVTLFNLQDWLSIQNNSDYNTFSWLTAYDNSWNGISLAWSHNIFENIFSYNNWLNGIHITTGEYNSFTDVESYDNTNINFSINNSNNNTFIDITANGSENAMWVYLNNSSNNNFMWLYASGNFLKGIHLYNSHNNTWSAVFSNSNEWGLYLENSTGNYLENFTTHNNDTNWVMFVSWSNNNTLSWWIVSGNMGYGIYWAISNNNIISNSSIYENTSWGIILSTWDSTTFQDLEIYNNTGAWIIFENVSWSTINESDIYENFVDWMYFNNIYFENTRYSNILSSTINNWAISMSSSILGIYINSGYNNTISGTTITWWSWSISIEESNNNTINNSQTTEWISMENSTWTHLYMIDTDSEIQEDNDSWLFLYTIYDTYTIDNNYIRFHSVSPTTNVWLLTGNTISSWTNFNANFNVLTLSNYYNSMHFYATWFYIYWSDWDGNIYIPTPTSWSKYATVWETWTNNITEFLDTIEVISGDTYITSLNTLDNWYINYELSWWISWQTLKILKSIDWETRETNTSTQCILNELFICWFNFVVDNIKLFAFWVPTWLFTGTTETWAIVTSGWVYTTDITITYENPNLSWATLNGITYASGDVISGDDTYIFEMEDTFGNTTGMTFTIDTTPPTFTGTTLSALPVVHNGYYTTWITITFDAPDLSGATLNGVAYFSGDLISGDNIYSFVVKDIVGNTTGMLFTIDTTNPIVTGDTPISWAFIDTSSNVDFSRSVTEANLSWYTLYIDWTETHTIDLGNTSTHTISLPDGSYTRYIVAHDLAWNMWSSSVKGFTIMVPLSGTMTFLTWNLYYNAARYTNNNIDLALRTNKLANYLLTGDIVLAPFTSTINGSVTGSFLLSGSDGIKTVYTQITDGVDTIGQNFSIRLDTSAPTLPTLLSPISGAIALWSFTLNWSDSLDAGAGTSWYYYTVLSTWIYGSVVKSGFTDMNTSYVTIAEGELGPSGTYYRYVTPVDRLWNTESTSMQYFEYSWATDTTPNSFTFTDIDDALTNRTYTSNTITITGMTANVPVLASVNRWALYISWVFVGSTWYVQNGWTVSVELISSIDYEETVSSTLTINWISDTFSVTTEADDGIDDYEDIESTLSNTEKLMIIAIFETLRDVYAGDKEVEFFNTFMVVLENRIDDYNTNNHEYEALTYLCNIIQTYYDREFSSNNIDGTRWIVNGIYIAPNGKRYPITYDSSKQRFTSSNFVVPKYFPTLDTLKYIIDINNPVWSKYTNSKSILARWKNAAIDWTRQSSPYTAPNKKSFYFFKTITGKYSSYTFTSERYFDSLDATKEFIYNSNK